MAPHSSAGRSTTQVLVVFGTRPEAIKLAPVVGALRGKGGLEVRTCVTAQHRELLDQVLGVFGIVPDIDLDLMRSDQTPGELHARALTALGEVMEDLDPSAVVVQGDTTTVLAAAQAAFYRGTPVAHVEAGLRSGDMTNPFPEEMNRASVSLIARWHFTPTDGATRNLLASGIDPGAIHQVGNTVIDALMATCQSSKAFDDPALDRVFADGHRILLLTAHRRESFGAPLRQVFAACRQILGDYPDTQVLLPLHPNPRVREALDASGLAAHDRVVVVDPLGYRDFILALSRSHLVVTDSGGVQEEAPSLDKPVVVCREVTERPEGIEAGCAVLAGTKRGGVVEQIAGLLEDQASYEAMATAANPYGDGRSGERIASVLFAALSSG